MHLKTIQQKRSEEVAKRNLFIVTILLLAVIALLYLNSSRLKTIHRQQMLAEENKLAEFEIAASQTQLELFKNNLREKSAIIDQLRQQLADTKTDDLHYNAIAQLLQSTIVTEEQWTMFKNLLEKIFPGFFHGENRLI